MPEFGLINMNGRLYDPMMGRMLSPDPDVTYPEVPLSYNRYAYAMNNPVNFLETHGENPFIPLIILYGATMSWKMAGFEGNSTSNGEALGKFVLSYTLTTAVTMGAGSIASGAVGALPGLVTGAATGGVAGAVSGVINAAIYGGDVGQAALKGMVGGAILGGLMGGANGAAKAYSKGLNPWTGKPDPDQMIGFTAESVEGQFTANEKAQFKRNAEEFYKDPIINEVRDEMTLERINKSFGIKLEKGELTINIEKFMDKDILGLTASGHFAHLNESRILGGFLYRGKIYLSPHYALNPSNVHFNAVAGHELIHYFHWNKYGKLLFNDKYSEFAAYQYTFETYQQAGYYKNAYRTMINAASIGEWGSPPAGYNNTIPYSINFNF